MRNSKCLKLTENLTFEVTQSTNGGGYYFNSASTKTHQRPSVRYHGIKKSFLFFSYLNLAFSSKFFEQMNRKVCFYRSEVLKIQFWFLCLISSSLIVVGKVLSLLTRISPTTVPILSKSFLYLIIFDG